MRIKIECVELPIHLLVYDKNKPYYGWKRRWVRLVVAERYLRCVLNSIENVKERYTVGKIYEWTSQ